MDNFCHLILLFLVFRVPSARHVVPENLTQLDASAQDFQNGLTELKDTMATLNSLSDIQKQLVEQQRLSEERMRAHQEEEEVNETSRLTALKANTKLLEELRGIVYRNIKYLTKNTTHGEGKLVKRPKDCSDIYLEEDDTSGVYEVWPLWNKDRKGFPVYCDMETDGGGWTVIHRWKNPDVSKEFFLRFWKEYKNGFGDLESAFWIGNELIYELTRQGAYELRFDFENGYVKKHSVYDSFFIADEVNNYTLYLGNYLPNGTAGDILNTSDSLNFTTQDRNNLPLIETKYYDSSYYVTRTKYTRAECEKEVGWWYDSSCEMDPQIHPLARSLQTIVKTEMKIRSKFFLRKKELPP